jgi:hypothetical protein
MEREVFAEGGSVIVLTDGTVHLDKGEIVPVRCDWCSFVYQPPMGSNMSQCPQCEKWTEHDRQEFVPIERTGVQD